MSCRNCICSDCLYFRSGRCKHGTCFDDRRARVNPYDKAHPDKPPRMDWSSWKTEQAFWCRGGVFYPVQSGCENYVKYTGCNVEECLKANVVKYQDGYIQCSILDNYGCEKCYAEWEENHGEN